MRPIITAFSILITLFSWNIVQAATTTIVSPITGNTTWTKADSPYIVEHLSVPVDASLTIEPGTILKIQPWATVSVYGTLTVGTPDRNEEVVVTSMKDDSVGGDTNADGTDTTPDLGDWKNIIAFPGASVHLFHTTLRYGGQQTGYDYRCSFGYCGYWLYSRSQLTNNGGTITVYSSTFDHTAYAHLEQFAGTSTIADSSLIGATMAVSATNGGLTLERDHFVANTVGFSAGQVALTLSSNSFTNTPMNDLGQVLGYSSDGRNTTTDHTALRVSLTIDRPLTLLRESFVYGLSGSITPSGSLTIMPGTIVKIYPNARLAVYGTLTVGDAASPLPTLITSWNDDIGGDSNGDGGATTPQAGDWRNITVETGGTVNVAHTAVRYGGGRYAYDYFCPWYTGYTCGYSYTSYGQLLNHGGTLNVHDVRFTDAPSHVETNGGTTTITHTGMTGTSFFNTLKVWNGALIMEGSSLHDLVPNALDAELSALPGTTVVATNNWWGAASGPRPYFDTSGTGARIYGDVAYTPWLTTPPDLPEFVFTPPRDEYRSDECSTPVYRQLQLQCVVPAGTGSQQIIRDG